MTSMRLPKLREFAATAAILLAVAGCSATDNSFEQTDAVAEVVADYKFVIPPGAGLALDAGTPLEILPGEFDARVGETIEIVNEDDRGHAVGPWFVGANQTLRQTFVSEGEFIGLCTVHPSGTIAVTISA